MRLNHFYGLVFVILLLGACQSEPLQSKYPYLTQVNPPKSDNISLSKVYIDSAFIIAYKSKKALLIKGNFPNGCTYLKNVSYAVNGESLSITLTAWQPADKMCTMALVPFSAIFDKLDKEKITQFKSVAINGKVLNLGD